jgi:diacylglycerol kinase
LDSHPDGREGILTMLTMPTDLEVVPPPRPRRSWHSKFKVAFRGIKIGVRGHSSFSVHFFFTALVLAAGIVLQCELWEWCVLLGCIGLVLTAELFNSAIEILFRGLDEATRERSWQALDISAGAVLLASLTASVVGGLIVLNRLSILLTL